MSLEVQRRLEKIKAKGKTLTVKVKVRKADAPKETAKFLGNVLLMLTKQITNIFCIRSAFVHVVLREKHTNSITFLQYFFKK